MSHAFAAAAVAGVVEAAGVPEGDPESPLVGLSCCCARLVFGSVPVSVQEQFAEYETPGIDGMP